MVDRFIGKPLSGKTIPPRAKKAAGAKSPRDGVKIVNKTGNLAETWRTRRAGAAGSARATGGRLRLHRQQALALQPLARQLAGPADRFRLLPRLLFRWLFVMT